MRSLLKKTKEMNDFCLMLSLRILAMVEEERAI